MTPQLNLIVALPRTRTAWAANYLTYGPSFCFHDALKGCRAVADLDRVFQKYLSAHPSLQCIGNSDSSLALFYPQWRNLWPDARVIVLLQPVEAAVEKYMRFTADHCYAGQPAPKWADTQAWFKRLDEAISRLMDSWPRDQQLVLDAKHLDNPIGAKRLWEFAAPMCPWNAERWRMLDSFRVGIIPQKITIDWDALNSLHRSAKHYDSAQAEREATLV